MLTFEQVSFIHIGERLNGNRTRQSSYLVFQCGLPKQLIRGWFWRKISDTSLSRKKQQKCSCKKQMNSRQREPSVDPSGPSAHDSDGVGSDEAAECAPGINEADAGGRRKSRQGFVR